MFTEETSLSDNRCVSLNEKSDLLGKIHTCGHGSKNHEMDILCTICFKQTEIAIEGKIHSKINLEIQ